MARRKNPDLRREQMLGMLGITPVCFVTDREIRLFAAHPPGKSFLGADLEHYVKVRQTVEGEFPGDEVTNLNDHRLYGGKVGFVAGRISAPCTKPCTALW